MLITNKKKREHDKMIISIFTPRQKKRVTAQTITLKDFVGANFQRRTPTKDENKDISK